MRHDLERIVGHRLCLRLVSLHDAAYIHRLRTDPDYSRHISKVTGTIADQRAWIGRYKAREEAGEELYYVVENMDGARCGLVRLYDISKESFSWGSWILEHNRPRKAPLESALLSFGVGFERLGLPKAFLDTRHENARAAAFYNRLRMRQIGTDALNIYFEYTRDEFLQDHDAFSSVIMEVLD